MATNDEIAKLIVQVEGKERVEELTAAIRKQEATLISLMANEGKHAPIVLAEAAALVKLTKELEAAERAAKKTTGGVAGFGQSMLQGGRIAQDFAQGGIGGIINNLEGLASALGMGPGIAGVVTALGVAFLVFKPQIEAFTKEMFSAGKATLDTRGAVEKLEEQIKELEKKPVRLAVDTVVLDQLKTTLDDIKQAIATFDRMRKSTTFYQKESGAAIGSILTEGAPEGPAKLQDQLKATLAADLLEKDEAIANLEFAREDARSKIVAAQEEIRGGVAPEVGEHLLREIDEAQKSIAAAEKAAKDRETEITRPGGKAEQDFGDIERRAMEGDIGAQGKLAALLRQTGGRVGGGVGGRIAGLAEGIDVSSPQALMEQDAIEEEAQAAIDRQQQGAVRRNRRVAKEKAAAEEQKKLDDAAAAKIKEAADKAAKDPANIEVGAADLGPGMAARVRDRMAADRMAGMGVDEQGRMGERDFARFRDAAAQEAIKKGMDPAEASIRAAATVKAAQDQLNQQVMAGMTNGMDLMTATQEAQAQAHHEVVRNQAMIANRLRRLEAVNQQLRRNANAVRQELEPIGQPQLNFGGR